MSDEKSADEMLDEAESQISAALAEDGQDDLIVDEVSDEVAAEDDVELDGTTEEVAEEDISDEDQAERDRARAQGWRPEEEYKGPPGKWKDYKEFNAVGDKIASKLNSKIDYQSEQLKKQEEMIKQLVRSQGEVAKQAKEEAIAELKSQRREAIEIGDVDAVEELDEKLNEVKSRKTVEVAEDEEPKVTIDDEVREFVEAESHWFNSSNPDMVMYAQEVESQARTMNPTAASGDIMQMVRRAVVSRFPDRVSKSTEAEVQKPKKAKQLRHSPVEGGTVTVPSGGVRRFSELPSEARKIAEQFDREGIMSKQDYMKQYNEGLA